MEFSSLQPIAHHTILDVGTKFFSIDPSSKMRLHQTSTLWTESPTPIFCTDWSKLHTCTRKQVCFLTAKVIRSNEQRSASETSSACRVVVLHDKHNVDYVCTVFPPCCYSVLWRRNAILDILGCVYDPFYKSFAVTAASCVLRAEHTVEFTV